MGIPPRNLPLRVTVGSLAATIVLVSLFGVIDKGVTHFPTIDDGDPALVVTEYEIRTDPVFVSGGPAITWRGDWSEIDLSK